MIVYRIAAREYIRDISGTGARLFGGRWNPKGVPCLYTSEHVSLALLERFVHAQGTDDMSGLMLLSILLPDDSDCVYHTDEKKFKTGWSADFEYSQWLGQQILGEQDMLAFSVPSAIVPFERNIIINPLSSRMDALKIYEPTPFDTDSRLLVHLMQL